jgi:hypothetical protein
MEGMKKIGTIDLYGPIFDVYENNNHEKFADIYDNITQIEKDDNGFYIPPKDGLEKTYIKINGGRSRKTRSRRSRRARSRRSRFSRST